MLVEADRRCELHHRVKEDLNLKVNNQIKQWQKDSYHKVEKKRVLSTFFQSLQYFYFSFQSMMQLREKKEMEEQFKKAQKPWAKLLSKVNKAKTDYHNACKAEKTAVNQERNASGDSALSADAVRN